MLFRSFFVLCLNWLFWKTNCEPKVVHKLRSIECGSNAKYLINSTCAVKAVNWNKGVAMTNGFLITPLKNYTLRVETFKRDYSNKYQPFLIDVTLNMCDVFNRRNFSPYGIIIKNLLSRFTTMNHTCPLEGAFNLRDLYIDENYLPPIPIGFYQVRVTCMENFLKTPAEFVGLMKLFTQTMEQVTLKNKKKPN